MRVPVKIYANEALMEKMQQDRTISQAINVSKLPGIRKFSMVMPDGHEGYGFPIGGVAAFGEDGVVSPGGVGYDINCGVRLVRTNLTIAGIKPKLNALLDSLYRNVPSGLGSSSDFRFNMTALDDITREGVKWAVENGYGIEDDFEYCEENGSISGADPSKVSKEAKSRGGKQLGSLGSGNHFLEIEAVDRIFDYRSAKRMGITGQGQLLVLIHTGSRGYGHQTCSDYLQKMENASHRYNIELPDRELAAVPVTSKEGEDYLSAMRSAANFAWVNRQLITYMVRKSFGIINGDFEKMDMKLVYDVAHNIAKREEHMVDGEKQTLYVHRKGATRAFGAGSDFIPQGYRDMGQPVLIPGSMGTASYVMLGLSQNDTLSFGSAAHGAGRFMSRGSARRRYPYEGLMKELLSRGIQVRAASTDTVTEEAPGAYKDVDVVAEVTEMAGLAKRVARLIPVGVVKG